LDLSCLYAKYVFAPLMDWSLSRPVVNDLRRRAVGGARGRVLEIGYGTGLNLPFYPPDVTSLTLLDRQSLWPRLVRRRMDACRARQVVTAQASAEKLPFSDATFDGVVSTFTLCTINDPAAALADVRRVLVPRGKFLFLEHGRAEERSIARWQDRLNGLQRWCGCGCNLNRPIAQLVEAAGLTIVELGRPLLPGAPRVMGSLYVGVATRHA
jgi:ubiquinone/menaquinone biosynthesis C-methylase UbiE